MTISNRQIFCVTKGHRHSHGTDADEINATSNSGPGLPCTGSQNSKILCHWAGHIVIEEGMELSIAQS